MERGDHLTLPPGVAADPFQFLDEFSYTREACL
jgi:hypothetical protein